MVSIYEWSRYSYVRTLLCKKFESEKGGRDRDKVRKQVASHAAQPVRNTELYMYIIIMH